MKQAPNPLFLLLLLALTAAPLPARPDPEFAIRLSNAAIARTLHRVRYDAAYRAIDYPDGDVPPNIGVCTDVVIRAYRALGIDLQRRVHEDMLRAFDAYPDIWGLRKPDSNIDHRRVPNLRRFFARARASLPRSERATDYAAGDLVTWDLPGGRPHIGIVTNRFTADRKRPLLVHNIGDGPSLEDVLFVYPISGHYRYKP